MKVTESPLSQERQELIDAIARDAAMLFDVHPLNDSPQSIVEKVNNSIVDLVFGRVTPVSQDENPELLLGALWGQQMVRQFSWHWADVVIDDRFREIAVIGPQQEMIVFPLSFAAACIDKQCICTVLLAFNMLLEKNSVSETAPGSYENIMLQIQHMVPPYLIDGDGNAIE